MTNLELIPVIRVIGNITRYNQIMSKLYANWQSIPTVGTKRFICGHCGSSVSSDRAYYATNNVSAKLASAYLCHDCNRLSLFDDDIVQVPAPMLGRTIEKLPTDIDKLYNEMRKASADGAYSLVVMGGRKLLMHIAVSLGAAENLKFVQYVTYLEDNHYTPPKSKTWVKVIKDMGNISNHELVLSTQEDAGKIIKFLDLLMTFNYEFADEESGDESSENEENTA